MSRPCKKKCICKEPNCRQFIPSTGIFEDTIFLKVEEYEVLRLIDFENYSQEETSKSLNVARTTVQAIYQSARYKIADAIVNSKRIVIEGGDYILNLKSSYNYSSRTYEPILNEKEKNIMRIAIPSLNGEVFQHFGKTEAFVIYDVDGEKIVSERTVETNGAGHGALAGFLKANEVELLICGGIGGGAISALQGAGIKIFNGAAGDTTKVAEEFLKGTLKADPNAGCDCHHDHEHHHEGEGCHCGDHEKHHHEGECHHHHEE